MKIKSQGNGINVSAYINTDELERTLLAPYKERVKVLEAQVKKRDYYIKNMHFQLKKRRWIIYLGYISSRLMKPFGKKINMKRMMILSYMYERNFTSVLKMKKDFEALGAQHSYIYNDVRQMMSMGLIDRDKRDFYYLLDKGRETVEYYEQNTIKMFMHMAKIKQDSSQMKTIKDSLKKPSKYSEEELKNRRIRYAKLMKPFWDAGYKKMPKDKGRRIEILSKWIKDNKIEDQWYTQLIFNWGSK